MRNQIVKDTTSEGKKERAVGAYQKLSEQKIKLKSFASLSLYRSFLLIKKLLMFLTTKAFNLRVAT